HRADSQRAVAQYGERHDVPAERVGELERGDLALAERALREVPQRTFTAARLVDRGELRAVDLRLHEKGRVRRVPHAADHLELGGLERGPQLGGRSFPGG